MNVNICRVCLCKAETPESIFENEADIQIKFAKIGFQILDEDYKSKIICNHCFMKLLSVHDFYEQVCKSEDLWEKSRSEALSDVKNENKESFMDDFIEPKLDIVEFKVEEATPTASEPRKKSIKVSRKVWDERDDQIKKFYDLTCYKCPKHPSFESFADYKGHAREFHDEQNPAIMCCNIKITKRYTLLEHMDFHSNSKELKCPICDKLYSKRDILSFHMKQMHGSEEDRPFQCDNCKKRFVRLENLRSHLKIHLSKEEKEKLKVHKCDECNIFFSSVYNLKNHQKYKHLGIMAFFCQGCAKHYKSRLDYEIHRRNVHGDEGPERAQCHLCSKFFSHKKSLQIHLRDTHNDQPGPHICVHCGHRTKSRQGLRGHIRMRHEERKFHCTFCEKAFQTARQLREHTTVHVGGALFSCQYCDRKFNSNSNMYKHLKSAHSEDWSKEKKARALAPHPLSTRGQLVD